MRWSVLLLLACAPRPGSVFIPVGIPDASVWDGGLMCATTCSDWGLPQGQGTIRSPLSELSGLAASRLQKDVLFAHNDSGDAPRFFAMSAVTGDVLQEFHLAGARHEDWEDMAVGPCPTGGQCLFLGDIGDNLRMRPEGAVYLVPEPAVTPGASAMDVPFQVLPFTYPMGLRHDAEALLVHPATGHLYLFTKESGGQPSFVYRFPQPLTPGVTTTLELVGVLSVPTASDLQLTAADISPCGDAIVVRMYNRMVMLRPSADFETAFSAEPVSVPVGAEIQGEAVAFAADGQAILSAGEMVLVNPQLGRTKCR